MRRLLVVAGLLPVLVTGCGRESSTAPKLTVGPMSVEMPSEARSVQLPPELLEASPGAEGVRLVPLGERTWVVDVYVWPSPVMSSDSERRERVLASVEGAKAEGFSGELRYAFRPGTARADLWERRPGKRSALHTILMASVYYVEVFCAYRNGEPEWLEEFVLSLGEGEG